MKSFLSVTLAFNTGLVILLSGLPPTAANAVNEPTQLGDYRGAREAPHPDWFKESFLDLEEDIAEAAASGKRLVLYFWQDGCPYCAELIKNNFTQRDISEAMQQRFDLVAINMWGDRDVIQVGGQSFSEKNLSDALRVNYTPTLMFFDEKGNVALRLDGYVPPERFRLAMDYASADNQITSTFREFVANRETPAATGILHNEPFFAENPFDLTTPVKAGNQPIAVYFEQHNCSACDTLHQQVLIDSATRKLAALFYSVQLDMWADTPVVRPDGGHTNARQWADDLGISYAPSIVFFDSAGKEVMRIDAFLKTFHTQSVFDYVLNEAYIEQPNFQRYISVRAETLREQGIDVNIWSY